MPRMRSAPVNRKHSDLKGGGTLGDAAVSAGQHHARSPLRVGPGPPVPTTPAWLSLGHQSHTPQGAPPQPRCAVIRSALPLMGSPRSDLKSPFRLRLQSSLAPESQRPVAEVSSPETPSGTWLVAVLCHHECTATPAKDGQQGRSPRCHRHKPVGDVLC